MASTLDNPHAGNLTSETVRAQGNAIPVDSLVWPSKNISLGFLPTGITTRGIIDVAVMGAAILFGIMGFYLLVRPDISKLFNKAMQVVGPAAETAAVA